jgi:predicted ATPase
MESPDELFTSNRLRLPCGSPIIRHLMDYEIYTIFPNTLREPQKQSREEYLQSHGENLASVIKRMRGKKRNEAIAEIVLGMQKVIPDLDNVVAQAVGGYIVPRFFVKPEGQKRHAFDVNQMSDGTLRVLGLLVALYQDPGPSIMALEEPELTVHPGLMQLLAEAIKEVGQTRQIFVTTHSPEFLDHFEPDQVIAVNYRDNQTIARPIRTNQKKAVREKLFRLGELMVIEGLRG